MSANNVEKQILRIHKRTRYNRRERLLRPIVTMHVLYMDEARVRVFCLTKTVSPPDWSWFHISAREIVVVSLIQCVGHTVATSVFVQCALSQYDDWKNRQMQ